MLVDAPVAPLLDVIMAVEDDRLIGTAQLLISKLRRAGLSSDMIASGSPRKRYDKATKINANALISLNYVNDVAVSRCISAKPNPAFLLAEEIMKSVFE